MNHLLIKFTNTVRGQHSARENFLSYSSEKQKKILKRAIEGANQRQMELEKQYLKTESQSRAR